MIRMLYQIKNKYDQTIFIDPSCDLSQKIIKEGIYDKTGLYFIETILSKLNNPVVFDVGANIGNHALRMGVYSKKVYLFEPQPILIPLLQNTELANNIFNWAIRWYGLSDKNELIPFFRNLESNMQSTFVPELKHQNNIPESLQVRNGDDVVFEENIDQLDFIKIDVEGFESKVVLGLENSIKRFRPIVFMEWDKQRTKDEFKKHDIFNKVFIDYELKAITRNPKESYLFNKIRNKIVRLFSKNSKRKRWIISNFNPTLDYRHMILMPKEKMDLFEGL